MTGAFFVEESIAFSSFSRSDLAFSSFSWGNGFCTSAFAFSS